MHPVKGHVAPVCGYHTIDRGACAGITIAFAETALRAGRIERKRDMADVSVEIPNGVSGGNADSRWRVLAGLRFFLALVVVCGHLTWFQSLGEAPLFPALFGGTSAVLGFLIVSGYSIGHSLQQRPVGFFKRRVLRIYPLYAVAVLYALVPFLSGADALVTRSQFILIPRPHIWVVIGNLLMMQNLICPPVDSNMLVWTLGIEVACYLLAPWFGKTRTLFLLVLIVISACAFGWLYPHLVKLGYGHYSTLSWGLPLLMFVWAWLAGYLLQRYRTSVFIGFSIAALGTVLLILNTEYKAPYSIPCLVGATLTVTFAGSIPVPRGIGAILNYLGDLSYPVYLFHLPTILLGYCIMGIENVYSLLGMALFVSAGFLFIEKTLRPILGRIWERKVSPLPDQSLWK